MKLSWKKTTFILSLLVVITLGCKSMDGARLLWPRNIWCYPNDYKDLCIVQHPTLKGLLESCQGAKFWDNGEPIDPNTLSSRLGACTSNFATEDGRLGATIHVYDMTYLPHEVCHYFGMDESVCGSIFGRGYTITDQR